MNIKSLVSFASVAFLSWSCGISDPDATIGFRGGHTPLNRMMLASERSPETATASLGGDTTGSFQAGDYVEVSAPDTPFYSGYPKSRKAASSPMQPGTMLIVLGLDDKFMHVQTEQGTHGYVANNTVVPQGIMVAHSPLNAQEIEVVDWSEIADTSLNEPDALGVDDDLADTQENATTTATDTVPETSPETAPEVVDEPADTHAVPEAAQQ